MVCGWKESGCSRLGGRKWRGNGLGGVILRKGGGQSCCTQSHLAASHLSTFLWSILMINNITQYMKVTATWTYNASIISSRFRCLWGAGWSLAVRHSFGGVGHGNGMLESGRVAQYQTTTPSQQRLTQGSKLLVTGSCSIVINSYSHALL